MGRWAQRKRTGGGPPVLNFMTRAAIVDTDRIDTYWRYAVDKNVLVTTAFITNPTGLPGDLFDTISPNIIQIGFTAPMDSDTSLTYSGTTPGIVTPQTIAYT